MNQSDLPIFQGFTPEERNALLHGIYTKTKTYPKNSIICHAGECTSEMGIILEGSVLIESIDFLGNKSILGKFGEGQVFAETYALCREPLMVDVLAGEDCRILFLDLRVMEQTESVWSKKLKQNLLLLFARKNLALSSRIFCTAPKTIRERLLIYLSEQAGKCGKNEFDIPFNREQLANYLNLDRSALSKELGKMQQEGILTFHKNHFVLNIRHPATIAAAESPAQIPKAAT